MLQITKYYKTIFLGFIQNNFAGVEDSTTFLDDFSKSENKNTFLQDNAIDLFNYLDNLNDKSLDNIVNDTKLKNLFKQIGIINGEIGADSIPDIQKKLKSYIEKRKLVVGIATLEVGKLKKVINIDTLMSQGNLRQGSKGVSVQALQIFLIKGKFLEGKADSRFGPDTETALKDYQRSIGYKNPDGVFTVSKNKNNKYYKTLQSIIDKEGFAVTHISERSATGQDVLIASKNVNESIEGNINMLKISKEFFKALEAREDGGFRKDLLSDMGSLLGLLREIFGRNNASEYFESLDIKGKFEGAFDKLKDPQMQDKFNKGYEFLVKDSSTRNSSLALYGFRDLLMVVFSGIPLFDVRVNFIKTLKDSGVDMRRATIFTTWVQSGMNKSFEKYEKKVGPTINTGENLDKDLNALKGTITAYITSHFNIEEGEITNQLIKELRISDTNFDNLIKTYIDDRFVPDAETLLAGGFNWFESIFDDKYDAIKLRINGLNGGEVLLNTISAKKTASSSKKTQNVFLLQNDGTFYIHIGSEYKNLGKKRPTKKEIEVSVEQYNKLSLTTYGGGMHIWKRLELDSNKTTSYLEKDERLVIANEVIDLFDQQNTKSEDNMVGAGKITNELQSLKNKFNYYTGLNNKNSKFLKSAIILLESGNISGDIKQTFGMINTFNSTNDFLNAYVFPIEVENKIKALNNNLSPEEYVAKLVEINKDKEVKRAFDVLKSNKPNALQEYRLKILELKVEDISIENRIDAKKHKYGVRMLTRDEFKMTYSKLQAKYKKRFDNKTSTQVFDQEFKTPKTFKDIYSFDKPKTYKEYIDLLSATGPNIADYADGKFRSTMNLWERGLIEAGVLDVTGSDLRDAYKDESRTQAIDIKVLEKNPKYFVNTARDKGYKNDMLTTFKKLNEERGDEKIMHTTIDRSFSFTTKAGENITRKVIYDVYTRPECDNIYVLPNSKSIQDTINSLKQDNAVSILNTPSLPVGLFSLLNNGGNLTKTPVSSTTPGAVTNPGTLPNVPIIG